MAEQYLKKREEIDTRYQWKLADLFESDKLWEQEYDLVLELAEKMKKLQGTLGECASRLLEYFQLNDKLGFHFGRVYVYANESYHQDTQVAKYQAYSAKCDTLMAAVNSACAFASPEILEIPEDRLASFYKEEPELENYRRALEVICRDKAHTLSNEEESLLAAAGEMAVSPKNIFAMLNNADMKFPSIQGADGEEIPVTHGNYTTLLTNQDIHVREQAYKSLYSVYGKLGNTIAATFLAHLKQERFYAKARHFSSTRARHLNSGNIPENVYDNLIEAVHKHLPAMHRYISLRKKALGVELLHMYDLFVPCALRGLQGQALQPGDPGGQVQGQGYRPGSRHDCRGSCGIFRESAQDPQKGTDHGGSGSGLCEAGPAQHHPLRRRGPAGEAGHGAGENGHGTDHLYPGRAHHGPPRRRCAQAHRGAEQIGGCGQYRSRHRAQSGCHQDGGPHHRSGPRRR